MVGDSWGKGHPHHTCGICCGPTMCRLLISPCLMELCSSQSGKKKKNCKALIKVRNFNTFGGGLVEESHCVGQADLKFTELLLLCLLSPGMKDVPHVH